VDRSVSCAATGVVSCLELRMTALDGTYAVCRLDTSSGASGFATPGSDSQGYSALESGHSGPGAPGSSGSESGAPEFGSSGSGAPGSRLPDSNIAGFGLPSWIGGEFWSITRTYDELSIVCPQECVPSGVLYEGGWRVLKVLGPLSFALTGILASISGALAEAGISIFALSTYDTDYILVKASQLEGAIEALRKQGVEFE
jgi:hypothetical protein